MVELVHALNVEIKRQTADEEVRRPSMRNDAACSIHPLALFFEELFRWMERTLVILPSASSTSIRVLVSWEQEAA